MPPYAIEPILDYEIIFPAYFTWYGTNGNDNLDGTFWHDRIYGLDGHDVIDAKGGNDWSFGGNGNDTIYDGDGNDYSFGGNGNDLIIQQGGDDWASGGAGNDRIYAFDGVNTQYGGSGNDLLYIYDDRAAGHFAMDSNVMRGGSGNDSLWLVGGSINAYGDSGHDAFHFYSGPEPAWHYAEGGTGNDTYHVRNVNESLFIQISGFDDNNETMYFHDGFGGWVSDLDSNNNGVLDAGDTYVTGAGGIFTQIQNGDLNVIIWENGFLDADAFVVV